jgi:hypothetical protein
MSDRIFYVGAKDHDNPLTGYVPAKFLLRNGAYVMDPTPGGSQDAYIYSDALGGNKANGRAANPNNYLIVPANYSEQQAKDFAARIANTWYKVHPGDETGTAGPNQALMDMAEAFLQDGSQDLQRHPRWGIPKGSVVPAFVGSASNHFGYVTALTPVPRALSEIGGGAANAYHHWHDSRIDIGGPFWLSRQNHANIIQGFNDGLAASSPPAPFNDYGYGPQTQRAASQIGDGNGIAGWVSSLAGIDPQEQTQPASPPRADRPIRYLSRRTQ